MCLFLSSKCLVFLVQRRLCARHQLQPICLPTSSNRQVQEPRSFCFQSGIPSLRHTGRFYINWSYGHGHLSTSILEFQFNKAESLMDFVCTYISESLPNRPVSTQFYLSSRILRSRVSVCQWYAVKFLSAFPAFIKFSFS